MTASTHERSEKDVDEPGPLPERYAALELETGAIVVYDDEQHTAWIQSDIAISLEEAV